MTRQIPTTITQNFSFSTNVEVTPIAGLTYTLSLRGPATYDFIGVANESSVTVSGVVTVAGVYRYTFLSTDTNETRTLIETGDITADIDPTAIEEGQDLRGHAQRVLDAIEAVIEKRATKDQESYTIAGRSLSKTPISELLKLRDAYKEEVKTNGRKLPRAVLTKFGVA